MKGFIGVMVVLALLLGVMCWYTYALDTVSASLIEKVDAITACVKQQDFPAAREAYKAYIGLFEKHSFVLESLIDHGNVNLIMMANAAIGQQLENEEEFEAVDRLAELRAMLDYIPQKEKPSLENIL